MDRQQADSIIAAYTKPVFGFALKRCRSLQDAEDLSQEIVLRAYRALLRQDIDDAGRFIWTVAHNALNNYYRHLGRGAVLLPLEAFCEQLADPAPLPGADDGADTLRRLRGEIARLCRLQRRIVIAYYFENRRQSEIAAELGIPLGTVKWHLFEAKKELKRGMDTMRETERLQFAPIRFESYGINGSCGSKTPEDFFRGALPQNICYCVKDTAKTVNEIADALGVSPVYVESEAAYLEEYGLLQLQKGRYLANFIILEPTTRLLATQEEMYRRVTGHFAPCLYDRLLASGLLADDGILCQQGDGLSAQGVADRNFVLWTLIPYIAAWSGEGLLDRGIRFEEVATLRPDGGHNIFNATVLPPDLQLPPGYTQLKDWCGPMWNGDDSHILWQIDSQWSARGRQRQGYQDHEDALRLLALYRRSAKAPLPPEDCAWLAERGYAKMAPDADGHPRLAWQLVILKNAAIRDRLLALGHEIKQACKEEWQACQAAYAKELLPGIPPHLRRQKEYELQFLFGADGWFLHHCIEALLQSGRLQPPTPAQRQALTTLILPV